MPDKNNPHEEEPPSDQGGEEKKIFEDEKEQPISPNSPLPAKCDRAKLFGLQVDPKELVTSEKLYLDRLEQILSEYHAPINEAIGSKKEILNEDDMRRVFTIVPLLAQYHGRLYKDLEIAGKHEQAKQAIANVLVKHAPYLRMYKDYVRGVQGALDFLEYNKCKKFREFIQRKKEERPLLLDLQTLLLLPVHRLPQYRDLMKSLLETTDAKEAGYQTVESAAEITKEVTSQINRSLGVYEEQLAKFEDENPNLRISRSSETKKKHKKKNSLKKALKLPNLQDERPSLVRGKSREREFSRSGHDIKTAEDLFVEQFQRTWENSKSVVYKDLPRLVRRMRLSTQNGACITSYEAKKTENSDGGSTTDTKIHTQNTLWQTICKIILDVATALETKEVVESVRKALNNQNNPPPSEHFGALQSVFENTLGLDSKTFKVFKTTHQSILVPAMVKLAETVFKPLGQNFKDVSRPDGWKIQIHIGEAVYVVHSRIEQSLHASTDPLHFECEWSLRLSFDKQLEDLKAVFVRIIDVKTHADMPAEERTKVLKALKGEGYLIA